MLSFTPKEWGIHVYLDCLLRQLEYTSTDLLFRFKHAILSITLKERGIHLYPACLLCCSSVPWLIFSLSPKAWWDAFYGPYTDRQLQIRIDQPLWLLHSNNMSFIFKTSQFSDRTDRKLRLRSVQTALIDKPLWPLRLHKTWFIFKSPYWDTIFRSDQKLSLTICQTVRIANFVVSNRISFCILDKTGDKKARNLFFSWRVISQNC